MSHNGIRIAAAAFASMQDARMQLTLNGDTQDLLLARMLENGNDAMKDRFCELIMMKASENRLLRKGQGNPPVIRS